MTILLPEPIAGYFAADNQFTPQSLERFFMPDAIVHDEGKSYRGLAAITEWRRAAKGKYQYTVEPLHFTQQDQVISLVARVAGNFPGSPVELTYTFGLSDGKIANLEIRL
ncbi:nuclear transport factor 2 family protein [Sodalis sp. RH16]|uniref:nuclear transport factor 2 family protein n=1 Tax=unclassified Sodalis (in: enterobacteria) TaxID=2636512 RepID=UPI0039B55892